MMAMKTKKNENLTSEKELEQALIPSWDEPYRLPDNWCWTNLSSVQSENGFFDGDWILKENMDDNGEVRLLQLSDIGIGVFLDKSCKHINLSTCDELNCTMVLPGDVLISRMAEPIARSCIVPNYNFKMITAVDVAVMRCNSNIINNKFLNYLCNTPYFTNSANNMARGTTRVRITRKNLGNILIPLPPLIEQLRIVKCIDTLFDKLDDAKEKAQEVIDGFENRKAAILHNAFTGELTKKWRKESNVSYDSWEDLTLNDVAEYKKGPFGSSITKAMFVPKGENTYKVYEQGNAIRKTIDYGHYYISEMKYEELKGFAVKGGDIIISCAGTIGEVYKLPNNCESGIINQALMRVRLFPNIEEKFFIYYFGEILKEDVNANARGIAIKNIPPFKIMKAMPIKLPTLPEQVEIVRIIDSLIFKEEKIYSIATETIERIEIMKKAILVRAFRGELGTNNPDEKSSIELLKQIL